MTNEISELFKRNIRLIDTVRLNKGLDKTGIAQKMGVTWPTISGYLDDLFKNEILIKSDNIIEVNKSYGILMGISVGSAQIKICAVNMNLQILDGMQFEDLIGGDGLFEEQKLFMKAGNKKVEQYLCSRTPDDSQELVKSINKIFASIKDIVEKREEKNILGIGIAFTGAVDRKQKRIIKSFNLPYADETDFEEGILLRNYLDFFEVHGINISIENNSTAAGIAEKNFLYEEYNLKNECNINRKYKDCKNVVSIYLGAGLGIGIIQDNKVYRGSNNLCGGAGHLEVPKFCEDTVVGEIDEKCKCGGRNCLDYRIRTDVFESKFESFRELDSEKIDDFFVAHSQKRLIMGQYMGHLINVLNNLLNPDLIIITGKLYIAIDGLWEAIQIKRNENNLKYARSNCALVKSQLGPIAPAIGAAICAYYDKFDTEIEWQ